MQELGVGRDEDDVLVFGEQLDGADYSVAFLEADHLEFIAVRREVGDYSFDHALGRSQGQAAALLVHGGYAYDRFVRL